MNQTETKKIDIASTTSPLSETTTTVSSGKAYLHGVYINTDTTAAVTIVDYNASSSPETSRTIAVIPTGATAGTLYTFPGARAGYSLRTVTAAAATGDISVFWSA